MRRQINNVQLRAAIWLAITLTVAILCVMQFSQKSPLQTDILALLPATERNPIAEIAVEKLANTTSNRAIFLLGDANPEHAAQAARSFANDLRKHPIFNKVIADTPPIDPSHLTALYEEHRFHLLTAADELALNEDNIKLKERLQQKLYAPFHAGLTIPIQQDPFGFTDNWLANLPLKNLKLMPENGLLIAEETNLSTKITWVFISADLTNSVYDSDTQSKAVDAVAIAEANLRHSYPNVELLRTGTVFYAEAARVRAEHEVDMIGAGSLIGMLILLYLVFRSIRPLALGLLSVCLGIAAATLTTIYTYGSIHLITLVFGASLIGEAIDYAIQYFAAHLGAAKNWQPMVALRRIAPGLTIALTTSLLGYSALTFSPFPALAQIGLFALVGLTTAWLTVFMLLPAFMTQASKRDAQHTVMMPQKMLTWWQHHVNKKMCYVIIFVLLVIAAPGWLHLRSDDDVHLLITRPHTLAVQEEQMRKLTGFGNSGQFFLIEGSTVDEVLSREEKLYARLIPLIKQGEISSYQGVSAFVPSRFTQEKNYNLWKTKVFADEAKLSEIFDSVGLRDEISKQQLIAFERAAKHPLLVADWLQSPISAPFRQLWLGQTANGYAAIGLPQSIHRIDLIKQATSNLTGVTFVDKAGSASLMLQHYREWGGLWLIGIVILVYGVLCIRYRAQQALVTLAPTLLAMSQVLGIFGYLHIPLTLFNIMGLILVLGVGINYAIFLREGGMHTASALAGVLLSAGTTLLSFGLLAFSSMPALSSFGLTLLIGVSITVALAPIVLTFDKKQTYSQTVV